MSTTKVCTQCHEEKSIDDFGLQMQRGKQMRRSECKTCRYKRERERALANPERTNKYKTDWKQNHKEQNNEINKKYKREKFATDENFRIKDKMSRHLWITLAGTRDNSGYAKVGCDGEQLRHWIQSQFKEGMTWENRKEWHIDHVPWAFFNLADDKELALCCHWSNLRPVLPKFNQTKCQKVPKEYVIDHVAMVKKFIETNPGYQTSLETGWWQRVDLWYGKNPEDSEKFDDFLERIIRSQEG
jgi:hypothetical protein